MNPFDWKNQPSKLTKELQRTATARRNANAGKPIDLAPRTFHVYSKAIPNGRPQDA